MQPHLTTKYTITGKEDLAYDADGSARPREG